MQEIRFHGRGGQGAVTGAYLLGHAAFAENNFAQAFPNFGVERTGAPVTAYVRLDNKEIRLREQINKPQFLIIQDPTLVGLAETFDGTDENTIALLNSPEAPTEKLAFKGKLYVCDATKLAVEMIGKPIFNTAMLGYFVGITKLVKLESLLKAVEEIFPPKLQEVNKKVVETAYNSAPQEPVQYEQAEMKEKGEETIKITYTVKPGSTLVNKTGNWGLEEPVIDNAKCIKCGMCVRSCPEGCIHQQPGEVPVPDLDYCKGCKLCAKVCPVKAIEMRKKGNK